MGSRMRIRAVDAVANAATGRYTNSSNCNCRFLAVRHSGLTRKDNVKRNALTAESPRAQRKCERSYAA